MPVLLQETGYTKTEFGLILSICSLLYGVGKFFNGMLADRGNPRYFMALGLLGSAVMNVFFGLSGSLTFFGIFWIANHWFQAMGWPPCARMLTHWYGPRELGTMWGIWNSSHQFGGAGILILAGWLIPRYGWESAFFVPAVIGILVSFFLINRLRDTPMSLGLPPIEEYKEGDTSEEAREESSESVREILFKYVLTNKWIWIVSLANFFVYFVRIGVLDWAPTFLVETKGSGLATAGFQVAGFELSGIFGALAAGWLSDKIFKGRRGPANVLFMAVLIFFLFYFWKVPAGHYWLDALALTAVGFLIYGPQMLVGVAAADFASKKAAATATGMTGTFGYLGACLSGFTGFIADRWGWDGVFVFFIVCGIIGTLLFLTTWNHRSKSLERLHNNKES